MTHYHSASAEPLSNEYGIRTAPLYARAFKQSFPELEVSSDVGVLCCAQFAVTKARTQQRSKDNYKTLRQWLLDTDLGDNITGRLFEYMGHIMFGEKATICPTAKDCYCRTYGLCNLACHGSGACDSHPFPKYSDLPEGWPWYNWDGDWQNVTLWEQGWIDKVVKLLRKAAKHHILSTQLLQNLPPANPI